MGRLSFLAVGCLVLAATSPAAGQVTPDTGGRDGVTALPPGFDGPAPPAAPDTVARDAAGRATIRAVRVQEPLRLDGRLEEPLYTAARPISDFVQLEPVSGPAASEKTEVWLAFDAGHIYVSVRCWDSTPARRVATEMRRDSPTTWLGNDIVVVFLDPYYDRRNGVVFTINPLGGRNDGQVTNERQYSGDWNPVWNFATGAFEGGWTVEIAIPLKSLRYQAGAGQPWGFNVLRTNRWKNELSTITRLPQGRGQSAVMQASLAATVVGLDVPTGSRNLDIKPYAISSVVTDRTSATPRVDALDADVGVDARYGLTPTMSADLTYNTDFAQVEADEAQVNLTRFSLFFPEKREFFLENQGMFAFGGAVTSGQMAGAGDTPILFYSRRIGLSGARVVPIVAGGRLTGRAGRFSIGALNIETGDAPAAGISRSNVTAVRLKGDILRRSSVGAIVTGRDVRRDGLSAGTTVGVDGTFGFFANLAINTYWAQTRNPGVRGDDTSYRAQLDYAGDRYGLQLEHLLVGDNFNPAVGFIRRDDMRRNFGSFRFSPRPRSPSAVRRLSWTGSVAHVENTRGRLETREQVGEFAVEFQNSDRVSVAYTNQYEFLPRPFPIAPTVTLPVGSYQFSFVKLGWEMGAQRRTSTNLLLEHGGFYDGQKTGLTASRGRLSVTSQFAVEPTYSVNWVSLPLGDFVAQVGGARLTYTMTPRMFASGLVQYNSSLRAVSANLRFRWEYRPGSELFVVVNEERDTRRPGSPGLATRSVIVKVNRLLRM
ncbi:MAG: DUF5916 domain-containing protein [Vicinamibacterales bacterium]